MAGDMNRSAKGGGGLWVHGLVVHYGRVAALRGISVHIEPGELVCLVGPNGAGKSTLMQCVAGVKTAREGSVEFDGHDVLTRSPERNCRAGIALVPEGRGIFGELTVAENMRVAEAGRVGGGNVEEAYHLAYELFPVLRDFSTRAAGLLSGGQQQQLAIARALITGPRLLLLDEPSIGLSPQVAKEVFAALRRLADQGMTVFIAEQRIRQVMAVADRTYVMNGGRIHLEVDSSNTVSDADLEGAYFGSPAAGQGQEAGPA